MVLTSSPAHILECWHALGFSNAALARALRVDVRTLDRWRSGESYPQHEARRNLAALAALHDRLLETFESADDANTWLHADSRYLGGLKPADSLAARRIDRIEAALEAIASGVFA